MRERYGRESVLVGFSTHHGTVTAASDWGGAAEKKRVRPGLPVLALCKATAVTIARSMDKRDGLNLLQGQVARAATSTGDREVSIALPSGPQLVGFAAPASRMKPGQAATAALEESAVVIAVGS